MNLKFKKHTHLETFYPTHPVQFDNFLLLALRRAQVQKTCLQNAETRRKVFKTVALQKQLEEVYGLCDQSKFRKN